MSSSVKLCDFMGVGKQGKDRTIISARRQFGISSTLSLQLLLDGDEVLAPRQQVVTGSAE
jgi:hypothetical protein